MRYLLLIITCLFGLNIFSLTVKMGTLIPEGTTWSKHLKKMSKEIKKATKNKVKLKYYFGGSQGDEPDVLRKIRVGQLHGGIFTGKTLGSISGDTRVLELPFTFFKNKEKASKVLKKMSPFLNEKFKKSGLIGLGMFDIGMVYFISKKKINNLFDLGGIKIWSWDGDRLVETILNVMNFISVPLALPDVLSSLSTGIIEATYAPPIGILSFQWNTKVKYIIDFPLTLSIGALLISQKYWKKISLEHQNKIIRISEKYVNKINISNKKDNEDALDIIKKSGIKLIEFPKEDIEKGKKLRIKVIERLKGKLFSIEFLERFERELKN